MKNLMNFFKFSLFATLIITMVSCGGDDPVDPQAAQNAITDVLVAKGATASSSVTIPSGATQDSDWSAFTVTFTDGNFTTSGVPDGDENLRVWPASGTWAWSDETTTSSMTRGDGVVMNTTIETSSLDITFTIDAAPARTAIVEGTWIFTF